MTFHVPEDARVLSGKYATRAHEGNYGAFDFDGLIPGRRLYVIASDGLNWEHVSVHVYQSKGTREWTPTWQEMCWIKDQFWDAEDVVVQFHPRQSEYVNNHAYTLHLWRPMDVIMPTPDPILVGYKELSPEETEALVVAGVL